MDPIQIIITIAVCIGSLIVLGFAIWLVAAFVILRNAKKAFKEIDDEFDRPFAELRRPGNGYPRARR